jgi:hypothetical protein
MPRNYVGSAFSKRHYELFATLLGHVISLNPTHAGQVALHETVNYISNLFAQDNSRFNRNRFLQAVKERSK